MPLSQLLFRPFGRFTLTIQPGLTCPTVTCGLKLRAASCHLRNS